MFKINSKISIFICLLLLTLQKMQGMQEVEVKVYEVKSELLNVINNSPLFNNFNKSGNKKKKDPQIILWYAGQDGLSIRSYDFYDENFFECFKEKYKGDEQFGVYLYDLSAWKGLEDEEVSLTMFYNKDLCLAYKDGKSKFKNCETNFDGNIYPVYSKDFFSYLAGAAKAKDLEIFKKILISKNREFIWEKSKSYNDNNITLKDLRDKQQLGGIFKTCDEIESKDTAKAYSTIQYLEGLWFIKMIIKRKIQAFKESKSYCEKPEINIIFLLPNDEYEYYQDPKNLKEDPLRKDSVINKDNNFRLFKKDLQDFINSDGDCENQKFKLGVYFQSFKYCVKKNNNSKNNDCFRPYLWKESDNLWKPKIDKDCIN